MEINQEDHEHQHDHSCSCSHEHDDCCDDNHEVGCCCEASLLENLDVDYKQSKKPLVVFAIGIGIFLIGNLINLLPSSDFNFLIRELLFLIIVVFVGKDIIKDGIKSLFKGKIKISLLMTISAFATFLLGDGSEGAILILLYYLAEYLEEYALDKSKRSIINLIKLTPDKGIVKQDGENIEINVDDINIGDIVIVHPGDKIPIDGKIIKGNTSINQSSITGESIPVNKKINDEVYGSTINEEGYIEIEVTKSSKNSVFSKIIDLVKESEDKKAKIDLFIDKFASIYTPLVVIIAILIAVLPTILFNASLTEWAYRALVLLVISCPCALAISTPVSMVSSITAGTKNGIIIKGGKYIEELSKIKAVLFDKTGTLTEGKLEIENIVPLNGYTSEDLIKIACSIESKSKHPIAKTFNEYSKKENINLLNVENFKSLTGKGLVGYIDSVKYCVGKESLFNDNLNEKIDKLKDLKSFDTKTKVIIADEKEIIGFISLQDKLKDNSKSLINKLKSYKIKTMMLTGDNNRIAKEVAIKTNLDDFYSNLMPEDKLTIVQEIVDEYKDVAMIGDGVNDSPSLAKANVGIAMGLEGSDVAVETADIVLLDDKLSKLGFLIDLSKKTMNIIKQNVILCLFIKGGLAILGVLGFINLWVAILVGDMGLTLFVVANAMRLSKLKTI
ncbi:MAG: cation-translocating P-type ATPase [Methanobacteriaceae archaeon]|jgi:Cd2+/Zn2+-exporting ATPase|nr:cation-translocating P-type ATPase [Methanobacteriaceae archaeon]